MDCLAYSAEWPISGLSRFDRQRLSEMALGPVQVQVDPVPGSARKRLAALRKPSGYLVAAIHTLLAMELAGGPA